MCLKTHYCSQSSTSVDILKKIEVEEGQNIYNASRISYWNKNNDLPANFKTESVWCLFVNATEKSRDCFEWNFDSQLSKLLQWKEGCWSFNYSKKQGSFSTESLD